MVGVMIAFVLGTVALLLVVHLVGKRRKMTGGERSIFRANIVMYPLVLTLIAMLFYMAFVVLPAIKKGAQTSHTGVREVCDDLPIIHWQYVDVPAGRRLMAVCRNPDGTLKAGFGPFDRTKWW